MFNISNITQIINNTFCIASFCLIYYNFFFPNRIIKTYEMIEKKLKESFRQLTDFTPSKSSSDLKFENLNVPSVSPALCSWLIEEQESKDSENCKDDQENVAEKSSSLKNLISFDNHETNETTSTPKIISQDKPENEIKPINSLSSQEEPLLNEQEKISNLHKKLDDLTKQLVLSKATKPNKLLKDVKEITNNLKITSEILSNKINLSNHKET